MSNTLNVAEILKKTASEKVPSTDMTMEQFLKSVEGLKKFFDNSYFGPRPAFRELMTATDFNVLVQKVVMDQMQQPIEGEYIGINLFSRKISVAPNTTVAFPLMGAIEATQVVPGQMVKRTEPAISMRVASTDALKWGVATDIENDLIDDSLYNIIPYIIEAQRRAMVRKKEELVWKACMDNAHVMYDNANASPTYWTSGHGADAKTLNGSWAFDDLIEMMAGLQVNGYSPTDIIMNPLAYAAFHRDPILRAQFFTMGAIGGAIYSRGPEVSEQGLKNALPWGINYHLSRFIPVSLNGSLTTNGTLSGLGATSGASGAANVTEMLVVDRGEPIIIIEREAMHNDRIFNQETEVVSLVMKEKYAVYASDQTRGAVRAKNIRLVTNTSPLFTVNTINL